MPKNPKNPRRFVTRAEIDLARKLQAQGKTHAQIGKILDRPRGTVAHMVELDGKEMSEINKDFLAALAADGFSAGAGEMKNPPREAVGRFQPALTGSGCGSSMALCGEN